MYLACKVEEHHVNADDFTLHLQEPRGTGSLVLSNELTVLSEIKFHLRVFHPDKPLYGFVLKLKQSGVLTEEQARKLEETARDLVYQHWGTDMQFLYPPATIALGALHQAAISMEIAGVIRQFVTTLVSGSEAQKLWQNVEAITKQMSTPLSYPPQEEVMECEKFVPPFIIEEHMEEG